MYGLLSAVLFIMFKIICPHREDCLIDDKMKGGDKSVRYMGKNKISGKM